MQTLRLFVDAHHLASETSRASLKRAAEILRAGGTVALPTETVYGLGANALDPFAIEKIFAAKERPSWDPLIVHISDMEMLHRVTASLPANAVKLIDAFWPGPLTLLLPKSEAVPAVVTAGRPRVGVRMPQHPVAHALIREAGVPVAAPSANRFGRTSPTSAQHVVEDLHGRIDAILDAGETTHGLESTVIDACEEPCIVYRPGVISLEQIHAAGVPAVLFRESTATRTETPASLPSPGVGLRHYAPRAKLILIDGSGEAQIAGFHEAVHRAQHNGSAPESKPGLMLADVFARDLDLGHALVYRWGKWNDPEELAQRLFAGLRWLDQAGANVILCPLPAAEGIGVAIRDRLLKAARTE
jgi:L-threonylcarbamoyladenylate synthase